MSCIQLDYDNILFDVYFHGYGDKDFLRQLGFKAICYIINDNEKSVFFEADAYAYGLKHISFGDENGYSFLMGDLTVKDMSKAIKVLGDLQITYCSSYYN